MVDDSGGFSSVAADFLQNIADEYTNTPVVLYTARDPGSFVSSRSLKRNVSRDLHNAVSFAKLSSLCKLIVPVGLPFLGGSKCQILWDKYNFLHLYKLYGRISLNVFRIYSSCRQSFHVSSCK